MTRKSGEAGTAKTTKIGLVHEHAVGDADAPNTSRMTNPPTILVSDAMIAAGRKASHWATVQLERDEFEAIYLAMKAQEQASDHSPDVELVKALEPLVEKVKRIDESVYWTERKGDGYTIAIPLGVCRAVAEALSRHKAALSNEVLQPSSAMVERVRELEETLRAARVIIVEDANACRAFRDESEGPSGPENVLAKIDAALTGGQS